MIAVAAVGIVENGAGLVASSGSELARGAIAGAFIVATAFLAGYAAIRRSGLAVCALLMVLGAAALQFSWLGFIPALSAEALVMIQALFAAAAIVFLSGSIGAARYNPLLGGVMFTAALVIGGMGLINFIDRIELSALMRWSLIGVAGFAAVLALVQAARGDLGARLILPGVALAAAAPLVGPLGAAESGGFSIASHGLFTLGVLAASIVALTESAAPRVEAIAGAAGDNDAHQLFTSAGETGNTQQQAAAGGAERDEIVLDSQIARVLDYSGVAIWDWSPEKADQTESLSALLGADSAAPFTPDAMRRFIHEDDAARFESDVAAPVDGPFDVSLKLFDGRNIRIRGARAANEETGVLERMVAFIETAPAEDANGVDSAAVRKATEAAIVPAAPDPLAAKLSAALDKGDIVAAFQPIVALETNRNVGYEALARWRDQEEGAEEGPETFVKAAESAGKGGVLAHVMLDQAASFLAEKIRTEKNRDLFVAINLSWGQMREPDFVDALTNTLARHNLPKNAIVLELTEADAVADADGAGEIFKKLTDAGAALAFDDFGAGFSSLSNLRKYDFDYLKIDKSFAADLDTGGDGSKIVAALAGLGNELGLKVIVEGVESASAAQLALDAGCAYGQGYALGEPAQAAAPIGASSIDNSPIDKSKVLQRLAGARTDDSSLKDQSSPMVAAYDGGEEADAAPEDKPSRWRFLRGSELR